MLMVEAGATRIDLMLAQAQEILKGYEQATSKGDR